MEMKIVSWCALGFSLLGNVFINQGRVQGYYLWIIANLLWIIYAVHQGIDAQILLFAVYTALAVHGIWSWKTREGRGAWKKS